VAAISKFQPDRCLYLRGFDGFGANAALWGASPTGFTVSGIFRAADDFAVLVIYDADDFFEHPVNRYLPDFDLSGIVLEFDVNYSGLQPLDSAKYPTIDWPYLDVEKSDGTTAQVNLFANATQTGGVYSAAAATITVSAAPAVAYDRVTIWYENNAADYIAKGGESAATVAAALAAQIAGFPDITATATGANIEITARKAGVDGNLITLYTQSKTSTLTLTPGIVPLAGGSSAATWHVRLDFTALGIDQVRQMFLTFAPPLTPGPFVAQEWEATFSNWGITADPNGNGGLSVAGPQSVRVEETDSWCKYSGTGWAPTAAGGFYSKGFANLTAHPGDSVTVNYWCQATHDLYLGTALGTGGGQVSISVDGGAAITLDTYLNVSAAVVTRRRIAQALAAGQHTVEITLLGTTTGGGTNFYFDFVEAAVVGDPPAWATPDAGRSAALDYDTDSTYKISPQRLMWTFDQLGLAGPMNLYGGVFWCLQRTAVGGILPEVTVDFAQRSYLDGTGMGNGDQVFVVVGTSSYGKTIFPADTADSIAAHFAYFLNEASVGVWASASGSVLTVGNRAAGSAYSFTFSAYVNTPATPLTYTGALTGAVEPNWYVDPSQTPALARGFRDWLADLCAEVKARGYTLAVSFSMEFVYPPDDPASGQVWAQRYPDGTVVQTETGFSNLVSTQCSFTTAVQLMHRAIFAAVAAIQTAAGLVPQVQFGEFSWWYFANPAGMAFYDQETAAGAELALGRPLYVFTSPDDDPSAHPADAAYLAGQLVSYVVDLATYLRGLYPDIEIEWLLPYDVNYPEPVGLFNLGGKLIHYVNIPAYLIAPATSPFSLVKMEALDFGSADRSMTLALAAMQFPFGQGWPAAKLRYLCPVFNGGCPYRRERALAFSTGYPVVLDWAKDHLELFGWDVAGKDLDMSQLL
jgi:hypothetical protein